MQNDEYTPELEQEENEIQEVEETVETQVDETEESTNWEAEAKKWRAIAQRNRAKQTTQPQPALQEAPTRQDVLTREEAILIAEGIKQDDLEQLQAIAKGKGISLLKAKEDPIFVAYYEKVEKERKAERAKLNSSKGSQYADSKTVSLSGLSKEEHKKVWAERVK